MTDWFNYGGITWGVKLIETGAAFIQDYSIQLERGAKDEVTGWIKFNGSRLRQRIVITIPETGIRRECFSGDGGFAIVRLKADFEPWEPGNYQQNRWRCPAGTAWCR